MLERERQRLILHFVDERAIVSVAELVAVLNSSEATVRRDIAELAARGELRRVRGGAEALRPRHRPHLVGTPFALAQSVQVAQKRAIARLAVTLIEPGSSIIINGGTTTWRLVEFLRDADLDILTNSFPIAADLLATGRNRITLPGGTIFREQSIVLSPFDNDTIKSFWGGILFTGCHGINRFGMMETDPLVVQAETKLLVRAERLIVLADSRKLRQRSAMIVTPLERVSLLITDDGARDEELQLLRNAGLEVMVAEVEKAGQLGDVA